MGDAGEAEGLDTEAIEGGSSAEIAVSVLELREELADEPPEHILIATSDDPEFAMPAAAWAARSGDAGALRPGGLGALGDDQGDRAT